MNEMGIKTGNIRAKNIVGARLHRMASEENIIQLFQNTAGQKLSPDQGDHASRVGRASAEIQLEQLRGEGSPALASFVGR